MQTHFFLTTMVVMQAAWLGAIWLSGATAHWQKLPVLIAYSAICGAVTITLPMSKVAYVAQFARRWVETERLALLVLTLGVAGVGALYAYQQLGWPDERMVFAASRIVVEQGLEEFFVQYHTIPWLGSQHPPLVPLLYGGALRLFGLHIYVIRSVGLVFSIATLLLTYRIGKELYSHHIGLLAACFLISMPFFFRLGTTALLDMPATFFFTLSVYTTLRLLHKPTALLAVVVGLSVGAGLLCRYTVVFIYPVLLSCTVFKGVLRRDIPYLGIVMLVSAGLLAIWLGYAAESGIVAVQQPRLVGYAGYMLTSTRGLQRLFESLVLRLPSGIGPSLLPILLLGGWQLWRRRGQADRVILAWIALVFAPVILTLPGARYFLLAFPALAIVIACGVESLVNQRARLVTLALLYSLGNLYLFVDWYRAATHLFVR